MVAVDFAIDGSFFEKSTRINGKNPHPICELGEKIFLFLENSAGFTNPCSPKSFPYPPRKIHGCLWKTLLIMWETKCFQGLLKNFFVLDYGKLSENSCQGVFEKSSFSTGCTMPTKNFLTALRKRKPFVKNFPKRKKGLTTPRRLCIII
ncbi:MAG: hypothetical protein IJX94_03100 [Clostridia bacterium]|nr:hypothetical protein [Clostridia bacterium]